MSKLMVEHLYHLFNRVKAKIYTKMLSLSFFSIGRKTTIVPPLRFTNLAQIQLGRGITIQSNCWIQVIGTYKNGDAPKLIIKDHVGIGMNATISAAKKIIIEEFVFTARNVFISDHEHEFNDIGKPISLQGVCKISEVKIGAHTWLGQNSVILPGVTIGKHCVIGANSVVKQNIPDYSIAVGAPARIVRRFNDHTERWDLV